MNGRRDDVRVRVLVAAPHRAVVLQDEDVAEARVAAQVARSGRGTSRADAAICAAGSRPSAARVIRGVGDQLVGADGVHDVEHAGAPAAELALDAEERLLVGGDAHRASRRRRARAAISTGFRCSLPGQKGQGPPARLAARRVAARRPRSPDARAR